MTVPCSVPKRSAVRALKPARNFSRVAAGRQSATPALITKGASQAEGLPAVGTGVGIGNNGCSGRASPLKTWPRQPRIPNSRALPPSGPVHQGYVTGAASGSLVGPNVPVRGLVCPTSELRNRMCFASLTAVASWLVGIAVLLTFIVWTIRKSDDPSDIIVRWLLTVPAAGFLGWVCRGIIARNDEASALVGVPLAAVGGLVLTFIWGGTLGRAFASPLVSLFDGGDEAPEERPAFSIAQARRKAGHYAEAIAEVRRQLERFPADFEGLMLLAAIQAEDLLDLVAAEVTVQQICEIPELPAQNLVFALYSLTDWQLKQGRDPAAARRSLEQVMARLPDTEFAVNAAQRLAHLPTPEALAEVGHARKLELRAGVRYPGLAPGGIEARPPEQDPGAEVNALVNHLEEHPLDTDARERLAILYADHHGRLDWAANQLEELIQQPHQPGRRVVHWLNLLADLQVRHGAEYETVRQTLQRIVDRDSNAAAADVARKRIALLKLDLKGQQRVSTVQMGTYEQNLGLKGRVPRPYTAD